MDNDIIVLTGATASGKTKISINLAKKINAEIICADSRIVYKDFDIVSAKPTDKEKDGVIHHLIDVFSPNQKFSAGDFVNLATTKIDEIVKRNKKVIICGGTWFYIKSLLDEKMLPECPINQDLRDELEKMDTKTLWDMLNKLDSNRASLIHQNNKDKIVRSIEMCTILGQPISSYTRKDNIKYNSRWYMIDWSRDELYERINKRVDNMVQQGLFDEFLRNKEKYPNSEIMKNTIGYSEFYDLENNIFKNQKEAIEKIKQHTRNFAKRQMTYFRSNKEIKIINSEFDIIGDL